MKKIKICTPNGSCAAFDFFSLVFSFIFILIPLLLYNSVHISISHSFFLCFLSTFFFLSHHQQSLLRLGLDSTLLTTKRVFLVFISQHGFRLSIPRDPRGRHRRGPHEARRRRGFRRGGAMRQRQRLRWLARRAHLVHLRHYGCRLLRRALSHHRLQIIRDPHATGRLFHRQVFRLRRHRGHVAHPPAAARQRGPDGSLPGRGLGGVSLRVRPCAVYAVHDLSRRNPL